MSKVGPRVCTQINQYCSVASRVYTRTIYMYIVITSLWNIMPPIWHKVVHKSVGGVHALSQNLACKPLDSAVL